MLETWRLSYFESEGLRVFFLLPRRWTDGYLPLSISTPADITRVMVGRVELVSTHQREALQELYTLPDKEFLPAAPLYADPKVYQRMRTGGPTHAELYRVAGREVPEALQLFDSLGRFRDALLAHEWQLETDAARRARLQRIMRMFSACETDLRSPQITDSKPTTAQ
jgi:hypothetical protein